MERIHEGYEYKDFEMPSSIEKKTICAKTGKLASSEACSAYTEYFAPGTAPTQSCPGHVVEKPDTDANSSDTSGETDDTTDNNSGTTTRHLITAVTAAEIQAVATVAATVAVTATAKLHLLRQPLKK